MKVSKVWNDDGVLEHDAITVGLYTVAGDDYYLIDTVELSDDNDWTYTFTDLASNLEYKILEEELENYTVDYEYINNDYDITVTITNTPITEVQDENIEISEDNLETDEQVDVGTEPTTNNTSDEVDTETFDHTMIMLYSVLGFLALTGIYTVIKRRKEI